MALTKDLYEGTLSILKRELAAYETEGISISVIEKCLLSSAHYWSQIKTELQHYRFIDKEEEVSFFKTIKPRFTSCLEYYGMVYHAMLFCPTNRNEERKFWQKETKRLGDFKANHKEFCRYYSSGLRDRDEKYFTRISAGSIHPDDTESYDNEPAAISLCDKLIAQLVAHEKFNTFVKNKLLKLS